MANVNKQILVCALVEDEEGLVNLPEILTVAGLDMIVIGPMDLSQSLGAPGNPDHPKVKAAMDAAIDQIRASTIVYGHDVMFGLQVAQLLKQGGREFLSK
jgi:4-hydroxy-2-oxoheptanedioate aldolase